MNVLGAIAAEVERRLNVKVHHFSKTSDEGITYAYGQIGHTIFGIGDSIRSRYDAHLVILDNYRDWAERLALAACHIANARLRYMTNNFAIAKGELKEHAVFDLLDPTSIDKAIAYLEIAINRPRPPRNTIPDGGIEIADGIIYREKK